MRYDILVAGVGGQGVILTSRLLGLAAMKAGLHVTTAETIGMSQREGAVVSHIRLGREIFGPLIPKAGADLIIGMEPSEAARNMPMLKQNGHMIVNTFPVIPASVAIGLSQYDMSEILAFINNTCKNAILVDATKLAKQAGNHKSANVVLLGVTAAVGLLPFDISILQQALEEELPKKYLEVNKKSFEIGINMLYNMKNKI